MRADRLSNDRFLLALLVASILHAVLILGVGFERFKPSKLKPSLAITLVQTPAPEAPEEADFLAQEHQIGSGANEKKALPRVLPTPPPPPQPAPVTRAEHLPTPAPVTPTRAPAAKPKPVLKQEQSEKKVLTDEGDEPHEEPQPRRLDLNALSQQIAEVSAELNESRDIEAKRTHVAYINSVNARKYKATFYEKNWQQKIERIGNLNYPDEARRQKLSGSLVLAVVIRPDGSVQSIKVRQSSGHAVLDDAAMRIVELAAPFAPLPEEVKKELNKEGADSLGITRTWRFYSDSSRMGTE